MVIEHFRRGDLRPVYHRFAERGRLASEALGYVDSWVTADLKHCDQAMKCHDRAILDEWIDSWRDPMNVEVLDVMTSSVAARAVAALVSES